MGLAVCVLSAPPSASAQTPGVVTNRVGGAARTPVPPATVSRTPEGGTTVRAVRVTDPVRIDGTLDERVYADIPPISDFIQQDPQEGAPATEKTEVWILFDDRNIYVSARCWDSHPERDIANEMRRDSQGITQNEHFIVIFDTFNDKRNGVFFQTNPLGAQRDVAVIDEINQNNNWNTVWDVKTGKFDGGWTAEFAIPFKSLRYGPGREQTWGVNVRRTIRWKNECRTSRRPTLLALSIDSRARCLIKRDRSTAALSEVSVLEQDEQS